MRGFTACPLRCAATGSASPGWQALTHGGGGGGGGAAKGLAKPDGGDEDEDDFAKFVVDRNGGGRPAGRGGSRAGSSKDLQVGVASGHQGTGASSRNS